MLKLWVACIFKLQCCGCVQAVSCGCVQAVGYGCVQAVGYGCVQALESGIRVQQGTLNSMNAAGNDIVRQAAAPDAQLLKQRQENINRRWKALCSEVFDRQKYSGRSATQSLHAYYSNCLVPGM